MTSPLPLPVLRQLLQEVASPLPWSNDAPFRRVIDGAGSTDHMAVIHADEVGDADLIVAAVNHLPALLDLVERQAAAIEAVQELVEWFDDQAEQNDETLRSSSPGAPWRDRHSGLRDAYANAADDLRTALSGITPTTEETKTDER